MAESDLDVRVRIRNDDPNAIPEIKEDIEGVAKAADELGKSSGMEDFATDIERTAEAVSKFSDAGLNQIVEDFTKLAEQADVTADTVVKFIDSAISEFMAMAAEAAKAGDTVKAGFFEGIANGMRELDASGGKFDGLTSSVEKTSDALKLADKALADFNAAAFAVQGTLAQAEKAVGDFNKAAFSVDQNLVKANKAVNDFNKAAFAPPPQADGGFFEGMKKQILGVAAGMTLFTLGAKVATAALDTLVSAVTFVQQGIKEAAQTQQLDTALRALGQSSGESAARLNQTVEGLEKLGFAGSTARETVIRMTQAELDLSRATELGEAARTQAIVTGREEGQVLETLVNAIANKNARSLRSIGITINQQKAESDFAATLGKTADELTNGQKQAALTAAALEQIGKASGAAAEGADNLNVVLNRVNKESKEASEQIGKSFIPLATAFAKLELAVLKFFAAFNDSPKVTAFFNHLEKMVEGATTLINEELIPGIAKVGKSRLAFTGSPLLIGLDLLINKEKYAAQVAAEEQAKIAAAHEAAAKKAAEAAAQEVEGASAKTLKDRADNIADSLKALTGPQVTEGFTNLSEGGRKAVNQLEAVFDGFVGKTGPKVVQSAAIMREAFFDAFAQQKTSQDFENFLSRSRALAEELGINFRRIEEEGIFRKQKATLEEINSLMTAFIDASQQIVTIQQTYNTLRETGLQHEIAMQRITAEVANDQAKLNALSLREAAQSIATEKAKFATISGNTQRIRDEQIERILEMNLSEKQSAEKILAVQKNFRSTSLKENQDYFNKLKELQAKYVGEVRQAELEVKRIREEAAKAAKSAAQTIRELERQVMTPEQAAADVVRERLEREAALKEAIATGDVVRAKEELAMLRQMALARAQAGGETEKQEEIAKLKELATQEQQLFAIEESRAVATKLTAQQNLALMKEQVTEVGNMVRALADQVALDIKVQMNPESVTQAVKQLQDGLNATPPQIQRLEIPDTALQDAARQVQKFLDGVTFTIKTVAGTQGVAGARAEAAGGYIGGYSPTATSDNILSWLTAGEYVQPVAAVRHYGRGFMESIRNMSFPRFAAGGEISPGGGQGGGATDMTTLAFNVNGQPAGKVVGKRAQVRNIVSALKSVSLGT